MKAYYFQTETVGSGIVLGPLWWLLSQSPCDYWAQALGPALCKILEKRDHYAFCIFNKHPLQMGVFKNSLTSHVVQMLGQWKFDYSEHKVWCLKF